MSTQEQIPQYTPGEKFVRTPKRGFFITESTTPGGRPSGHFGVDYGVVGAKDSNGNRIDIDVKAATTGIVFYSGSSGNSGYGNVVIVKFIGKDGDIYYSLYAHLSENSSLPAIGSGVVAGQSIGFVGNTGMPPADIAAGRNIHLHYEVWNNKVELRPAPNFFIKDNNRKEFSEDPEKFNNYINGPYNFKGNLDALPVGNPHDTGDYFFFNEDGKIVKGELEVDAGGVARKVSYDRNNDNENDYIEYYGDENVINVNSNAATFVSGNRNTVVSNINAEIVISGANNFINLTSGGGVVVEGANSVLLRGVSNSISVRDGAVINDNLNTISLAIPDSEGSLTKITVQDANEISSSRVVTIVTGSGDEKITITGLLPAFNAGEPQLLWINGQQPDQVIGGVGVTFNGLLRGAVGSLSASGLSPLFGEDISNVLGRGVSLRLDGSGALIASPVVFDVRGEAYRPVSLSQAAAILAAGRSGAIDNSVRAKAEEQLRYDAWINTLNDFSDLTIAVSKDGRAIATNGSGEQVGRFEDGINGSKSLILEAPQPGGGDPIEFVITVNTKGDSSKVIYDNLGNPGEVIYYNPDGTAVTKEAVDSRTILSQKIENIFIQIANEIKPYENQLYSLEAMVNLAQAVKNGDPLAISVSSLKLASVLAKSLGLSTDGQPNPVSGLSSAAATVQSLMSLEAAIARGDGLGALQASLQTVNSALTSYALFTGKDVNTVFKEAFSSVGIDGVTSQTVSSALAVVAIAINLSKGDYIGAAVAAASMIPGVGPYIAAAYAIITTLISLFDDNSPEPRGSAELYRNDQGVLAIHAVGIDGGDKIALKIMQDFQKSLESLVEETNKNNPNAKVGIIADSNRMARLEYSETGYVLYKKDLVSGEIEALTYDANGVRTNAVVGSEEYFRDVSSEWLHIALERQAIAPQWMVDNFHHQWIHGAKGLTEIEIAEQKGLLAPKLAEGATTQNFRPVVLDLGGDGITTISQSASKVVFDVDGSGFLKDTGWVGAGEGILALDLNGNGRIDQGVEVFSNAAVADGAKGVSSLAWVDSNRDNKLTYADPVFNHLRVWVDANSNGIDEAAELRTLSQLGITQIDYVVGQFVGPNGIREVASPNLTASTAGAKTESLKTNDGFVVQESDGTISLIATEVKSASKTNYWDDSFTSGIEDVPIVFRSVDLLANDFVPAGSKPLVLSDVFGAQHGTVSYKNGSVTFKADANYNGNDAGFFYTTLDSFGTARSAHVTIGLKAVNDAPTIVNGDGRPQVPIYGYVTTYIPRHDDEPTVVKSILYEPGTGTTTPDGTDLAFRDQPIGYVADPNVALTSRLTILDPDDTAFTFSLVGAPHSGTATVNADGSWNFLRGSASADAFVIEVKDGRGGVARQVVMIGADANPGNDYDGGDHGDHGGDRGDESGGNGGGVMEGTEMAKRMAATVTAGTGMETWAIRIRSFWI